MANSHNATTGCGDGLLGPGVWSSDGCRGGFDFTLTFQESILTILPAALFVLLAGPRAVYLFHNKDRAKRSVSYTSKLITASSLAGLHVGQVAIVASSPTLNSKLAIASAVLSLLAAVCIVLLAHAEHVKSIRPSFLLTAYLFVSLLFDAARSRTEWLETMTNTAFAGVLSAVMANKLALLILETVEKRNILLDTGKSPSSESTSGPFSRGLFVWLNPLLITGWATMLTNKDLPNIHERLATGDLEGRFARSWEKTVQRSKKPSLFWTTFNILKWDILSISLPRLMMIGLSISQPFLISNALRFLAMADNQATKNLGYGLVGAFGLVFFGSALVTAWYEHLTYRAGSMVRGGLIALVYRKLLRMPTKDLQSSSAVSLMGNDVETLTERLSNVLIELWANTITVGIAMGLLYMQLGAVFVAPVITAFLSLGASTALGRRMAKRQIEYQKATQDRINFTSEVLGSMKAVKMLGFTDKFTKLISTKRDMDINTGKNWRVLSVWVNAIANGNNSLTQTITFGAYAISAKLSGTSNFSAAQAITALSILNVMMLPLSNLLADIRFTYNVTACFKRVQDFLLLDERVDKRHIGTAGDESVPASRDSDYTEYQEFELKPLGLQKIAVTASPMTISGGTFNWGEQAVLQDINTSLPHNAKGSLTAVVGPIGCGKSTLLKAILGETVSFNGEVSMSTGAVAFCDQTPWAMNASIRDNIIAESKGFDEAWFETVVDACDLTIDLERLPHGALTIVGDKGLKLSGGQKQRIAMARAVYSRKRVAIFDDVFSGLDKITEQAVFSRVFSKTGLLQQNGTIVILATHAVHRLPESDYIIALDAQGRIVEQGTFADLRNRGSYIQSLDVSPPSPEEEETDDASSTGKSKRSTEEVRPDGPVKEDDEMARPSDSSTFWYYLRAVRFINIGTSTLYIALSGVLTVLRYLWVTWWGDAEFKPSNDVSFWLGMHALFSILETLFISLSIMQALIFIGPVSGKTLHTRVLNAVMGAPLSFLAKTETGSLVNRFSQDMRYVDMVLPISLAIFSFESFSLLCTFGLSAAAVSWFAISVPIVVAVLVLIQRFYVRTSKQLRLLEIECKAPLFSHFLESINGLPTIRAFGWVRQYNEKHRRLLDEAQKPSYLLYCIQRWLTLVLDVVVAVLTVTLIGCAVALRSKINPSLLGIALVTMMDLGSNLKGLIIQWSTLETSLGAVTRIRQFSDNAPEETQPEETRVPKGSWPADGTLKINNVSVQYDSTEEPILRGITLDIKHGQKVGLCGRSGSGKSSLIQALLRLTNIVEGQILLDDEDITTVPRSLVREKLSCLTQDPFIFTNTIKFNVDPLEEHNDDELVGALERVGLWSVIKAKVDISSHGHHPLYEKMDETFFSHGQRQLLCLARALLKKSSILILDEPTSSVDSQTDAKMQEVIRSEFQDRTIIMIAHRLDTLLDFDKIAVLDGGSLVEYDAPSALLNHHDGHFARLYRADKSKQNE